MDKKERIIRASASLFSKKGYEGTSVESIAKRARVSKSSIFYYFGSKKNLYVKTLEWTLYPFLMTFSKELDSIDDPEEFVEKIVDSYLRFINKRRRLILIIVRDLLDGGKHFGLFLKGIIEESILKKTLKKFEEWKKQGRIKQLPPHQIMLNLFSMLYFPFIAEPALKYIFGLDPRQESFLEERKRALLAIFLHGIAGGQNEKD